MFGFSFVVLIFLASQVSLTLSLSLSFQLTDAIDIYVSTLINSIEIIELNTSTSNRYYIEREEFDSRLSFMYLILITANSLIHYTTPYACTDTQMPDSEFNQVEKLY